MRKVPHSFEVHSNESACRKKVRLGLEQVIIIKTSADFDTQNLFRNVFNEHLALGFNIDSVFCCISTILRFYVLVISVLTISIQSFNSS